MTSITDPLLRTTHYGWCSCGALVSITDANSHETQFTRDVESRVTSKIYQDGSHVDTAYDTVGRVSTVTDARLDVSTYSYNMDNTG